VNPVWSVGAVEQLRSWVITQPVNADTITFVNASTPTGTNYNVRFRCCLVGLRTQQNITDYMKLVTWCYIQGGGMTNLIRGYVALYLEAGAGGFNGHNHIIFNLMCISIMKRQIDETVLTVTGNDYEFVDPFDDMVPDSADGGPDRDMRTYRAQIANIACSYQNCATQLGLNTQKFDDYFEPQLISYAGALGMMNKLKLIWAADHANAANFNRNIAPFSNLRGARISHQHAGLNIPYIPNVCSLVTEPRILLSTGQNGTNPIDWVKYLMKVIYCSCYCEFLDNRIADRLIATKPEVGRVATCCVGRYLKVLGWAKGTENGQMCGLGTIFANLGAGRIPPSNILTVSRSSAVEVGDISAINPQPNAQVITEIYDVFQNID